MFLFHHSSQVESAPVTEPDPIGNAVPRADILERKGLAFAGLFFALLLWIALSVSLPAYAGFVPKLSDQRFSSQLADMTEEYDKEVTRQQAARNPYINERLIVKSYDTLNPEEYGAVDAIRDRDGHYILQFTSSAAARRAEKRLEKRESTIYVEPDYPIFAQDEEQEDAMEAQAQDAVLQAQEMKSWGTRYTGCDTYAASLRGKAGLVKVAVLDTGILSTHEMFTGGLDCQDQSPEDISDVNGHGTSVAGVVAECTSGLNQIQIVPVRVLDRNGQGSSATVGSKINAMTGKVQVMNLSLVTEAQSSSMLLKEEIHDAVAGGAIVVIAAGNQGDSALMHPPANIKDSDEQGVLVVSGCNQSGNLYSRSNYGESVDVCAPGEGIRSASSADEHQYVTKNGTSFSAPCVSAAAAMLILNNSTLNPIELERLIKFNYVNEFSTSGSRYYGTGILNMYPSVQERTYVENVVSSINKIPDRITLYDSGTIFAARKKYDSLTDTEKENITNYTRLTDAENQIKKQKQEAEDVENTILNLPDKDELKLSDKSKVADARKSYDALNDSQKYYIKDSLIILEDAESKISELEKQAEEKRKAEEAAKAEAERKAQEAARAEAERKAQEAAKAEAERKAAEAKLLASKPYANVEDLVPLKKKQRTDRLKVMGLTGGDYVVSWASSDTGKVTVSGNPDGSCIVTAGRKTGKAVITASCKSGKTVAFRIKVQKKKVRTRKIRIPSKKVSIAAGQSLELDVQPFPITSVDKVKYTSKNPGVVRVDASGILTAKAPGDAVVVVKSGSKKVKVKVTVY